MKRNLIYNNSILNNNFSFFLFIVKGTARCLLKQASGDAKFSCLAAIPSWYHDHEAGVCKEFIYGGCGGNANRFNSKADCDAACASLHADDHQHHHHH